MAAMITIPLVCIDVSASAESLDSGLTHTTSHASCDSSRETTGLFPPRCSKKLPSGRRAPLKLSFVGVIVIDVILQHFLLFIIVICLFHGVLSQKLPFDSCVLDTGRTKAICAQSWLWCRPIYTGASSPLLPPARQALVGTYPSEFDTMPATASMPNLRHKSPRRFFTFSPPTLLPALPDLSPSKQRPLSPASSFSTSPRQSSFETALRPGLGVEIVRTPEEALKGMRQPKQAFSAPPGGPRSGTRPKPLLSVSSPVVPRTPRTPLSATYPRNPPKSPQKHVLPPTPFTAVLLELIRRSAGSLNQTVVTLEFAYALDEPHRSMPVSLPLEVINLAGGHLGSWIENRLDVDTDTKPELTDGESAEDSDLDSDEWGLGALLRYALLKPIEADVPETTSFTRYSRPNETVSRASLPRHARDSSPAPARSRPRLKLSDPAAHPHFRP